KRLDRGVPRGLDDDRVWADPAQILGVAGAIRAGRLLVPSSTSAAAGAQEEEQGRGQGRQRPPTCQSALMHGRNASYVRPKRLCRWGWAAGIGWMLGARHQGAAPVMGGLKRCRKPDATPAAPCISARPIAYRQVPHKGQGGTQANAGVLKVVRPEATPREPTSGLAAGQVARWGGYGDHRQ